jgi:hypothetical protein
MAKEYPAGDVTWGACVVAKRNYALLDCFQERLDDRDWARIDNFLVKTAT